MAQVPAIIYQIVYPWEDSGYVDMIYVNDLSYGEEDPYLCACWDFYMPDAEDEKWIGKYQPCYIDVQVEWYKANNAWRVG